MNSRIIEIRALDKKTENLTIPKNIVPSGKSWINTVREAIGMTALQLAKRLGVTQPRIAAMEKNEENLKISTLKNVAKAMNCEFVYYFKPKTNFQGLVKEQAKTKAKEIYKDVNLNMALEAQGITADEAINDMVQDFINNKTKQIWD